MGFERDGAKFTLGEGCSGDGGGNCARHEGEEEKEEGAPCPQGHGDPCLGPYPHWEPGTVGTQTWGDGHASRGQSGLPKHAAEGGERNVAGQEVRVHGIGEEAGIPPGTGTARQLPAQWHQPAVMPGQPVSPGCSDRGDPVPGCGGQSTPGSPHPPSLQCPTCRSGMWGVWGNAWRSLCPHRGWDLGWQTGLRSSAARHRAISQHVPAWDMVVSPLLLQKSRVLAPRDTNVPMSPLPPRTPLAPASPSALGGAEGGCARNWASPAPH